MQQREIQMDFQIVITSSLYKRTIGFLDRKFWIDFVSLTINVS